MKTRGQISLNLRTVLIFILLSFLMLGYQNCSETNFEGQKASPSEASDDGNQQGFGDDAGHDDDSNWLDRFTDDDQDDQDDDDRWSDNLDRWLDDPFNNSNDRDDTATDYATQTGGPNCHEQLQQTSDNVHMIFVVDTSGSNVSGNGGFFSRGTDPSKIVRAESMQRFFNSYKDRANFSWSLIAFADKKAKALVQNAVAPAMQSALHEFRQMRDDGKTPYIAALEKAEKTMTDNQINIVVFLSDGVPQPMVDDDDLRKSVQEIHSGADKVSFNTVYYGPSDREAADRLNMMASVGQGNFLDTNANATGNLFLISDLVILPGTPCN